MTVTNSAMIAANKKHCLTHKRLLEVLSYEPETGKLRWLKRISIRVKAVGVEAGSITPDGYIEIGLDGHNYQAHCLAWFYMTGEWSDLQIDHKDTDRKNNKWMNLRKATHGQNVQNSGPRKNNKSGFKGVSFNKERGLWQARIMSERKLHLLGHFETPQEAREAYASKAIDLHGEFARVA
jgi:hypothetical protein